MQLNRMILLIFLMLIFLKGAITKPHLESNETADKPRSVEKPEVGLIRRLCGAARRAISEWISIR